MTINIAASVAVSVVVWLILTRTIGHDPPEKPAKKTQAALHGRATGLGDKVPAKGERRRR